MAEGSLIHIISELGGCIVDLPPDREAIERSLRKYARLQDMERLNVVDPSTDDSGEWVDLSTLAIRQYGVQGPVLVGSHQGDRVLVGVSKRYGYPAPGSPLHDTFRVVRVKLQEEEKVIHYASFRYDGDNYLAAGVQKDYLPVFVERSPKRYSRHGKTRWPSWSKFMHGEVDNYEEGSVPDIAELERRFGVITTPVRTLTVDDRLHSRWTDNPFQPPDASPELLEWYARRDEAILIWRETGDDTMAVEIGLFPSREEEEELEKKAEAETQLSALRELEADQDLAQLGEMLTEFDALELLGVSPSEETHSDILAWLLDPREKHLMGDFFLRSFLQETNAVTTEQIRGKDWSNTEVRREWHNVVDGDIGRLDILVLNVDNQFACAIENKVFSGEHSGQLTRYRKALERQHPTYHRTHVFLTRHGKLAELAEERKQWNPMDYRTILRLVEKTLEYWGGRGAEGVMAFLRQYQKTLGRRIVPETETRRIANNLYLRHRKAIDLIVKHKEDHIADLSRICEEVTKQKTNWELIGEREKGELIGFVDPAWKEHCLLRTGTGLGKQPNSLLVLDYDFRDFGEVRLLLTIMDGSDEDVRKSLFEKTQERPDIFNHRNHMKKGRYSKNTVRLYASEPIVSSQVFFEGDRGAWRAAIERRVSDFVENEYPKMNEIILASLREIEGSGEAN